MLGDWGTSTPNYARNAPPAGRSPVCIPGPPGSQARELGWFALASRLRAPSAGRPPRPRRLPFSAEKAASERAPTVYKVSLSPQGERAVDAPGTRPHREARPSGKWLPRLASG